MKSASLTRGLLAFGLLAAVVTAQTTTSAIPVTGTPTYLGIYQTHSGQIVPGPAGSDGTEIIYDNTAANGFFFTPGAGVYNMDWGDLAAGSHNFLTTVQIGYCTSTIGTVDLGIRIMEGAEGFGNQGTTVCNLLISGLPGSEDGAVACFILDLDLVGAELSCFLGDGPIGYSYEVFDDNTGPLLIGPPNEAGVEDAFDQFASVGDAYIGTFFFGGPPVTASFHMQLQGLDAPPSTACFLLVGADGVALPFPSGDQLLVDFAMFFPVTMETMPVFTVPNDPILNGLEVYWQVYMNNNVVFPNDPLQLSNGIRTTLGDPGLPVTYGPSTTIDLIPNGPTLLGGTIDMDFYIQGM